MLDRPSSYTSNARRLVVGSLERFADQCREGFAGGRQVRFPARYRSADAIVVAGMGGSTLGSDVVRAVFAGELPIPFSIVNGYELPAYVGRRTLVVLSSYSGTTEETLAAAADARRRGALITGLTTGGALAKYFERHKYPWYRILPVANPAGQPRMGLGYNAMGQIGLLTALGYIRTTQSQVDATVTSVIRRSRACHPTVPTSRNPAKQLARGLAGRLPVLFGHEHLVGSVHAFANQLNETAKAYAVPFALPELNHHLLEGLRFPAAVRRAAFLTLASSFTSPRVRARQRVSAEILRRQGGRVIEVVLRGRTRLEEAFDLLALAGSTSLFLSVLHRADPLKIATVNELKRRLAQM